MINIYRLKPYKDQMLQAPATWLREHCVSANMVTTAGLALGLGAAACILGRRHAAGFILLLLSIGADLLDGTIARLETARGDRLSGKLLDAVCDRTVELAWIGALIGAGVLKPWAFILAGGSVLMLFCRIWAYRRGVDTTPVFCARFERMTALLAAALFPGQWPAAAFFYLIALGTWISIIQILTLLRKRRIPTSPPAPKNAHAFFKELQRNSNPRRSNSV